MNRLVVLCGALLVLACSPKAHLKKELARIETSLQEHAGFALYDPAKKKYLLQHRADRYYTPASNTKIFTFYTSLRLLPDSLPALKYVEHADTLFFWGLGDPSFLYRYTHQSGVAYNFLKNHPGKLVFNGTNFYTDRFGPGWAWDDYKYSYSPERSSFPIYGNLMAVERDSLLKLRVHPSIFADSIKVMPAANGNGGPERQPFSNRVTLKQGKMKPVRWELPIRCSDSLLVRLLADTLQRPVYLGRLPNQPGKVLKSVPADSVYKVMMQESDNFMAEQLLLQCAAVVSDSLHPDAAIRYAGQHLLAGLPDKPQWVDGSGLSRYNLFTPRSVVALWEKIANEFPKERIYPLLATGGRAGTIRNLFKAPTPYVFGKTGTLSNNHCLSGYLITKRGRTLIFSFMHNNFVRPTREVRQEMEKFLNYIRDNY